jgi:hypothetical protein
VAVVVACLRLLQPLGEQAAIRQYPNTPYLLAVLLALLLLPGVLVGLALACLTSPTLVLAVGAEPGSQLLLHLLVALAEMAVMGAVAVAVVRR